RDQHREDSSVLIGWLPRESRLEGARRRPVKPAAQLQNRGDRKNFSSSASSNAEFILEQISRVRLLPRNNFSVSCRWAAGRCLAEKGGSRTLRESYDPQTGFED